MKYNKRPEERQSGRIPTNRRKTEEQGRDTGERTLLKSPRVIRTAHVCEMCGRVFESVDEDASICSSCSTPF